MTILTNAGVPQGIAQLIQQVGFPIFTFLLACAYIYWKEKQYDAKMDKLTQLYLDQQKEFANQISEFKDAINNNTATMLRFRDTLDDLVNKKEIQKVEVIND